MCKEFMVLAKLCHWLFSLPMWGRIFFSTFSQSQAFFKRGIYILEMHEKVLMLIDRRRWGGKENNIRTHLMIEQMIVTKTLFSIPALPTFVPASINHLYSICVPRQCTALMPCMLLHSGDVQCVYGLRSRWKVHLLLAQYYLSLHAGVSLFI